MEPIAKLSSYINSAIPYAWDDSESWFEFLGKVLAKVNEVVAASNDYFAVDLTQYTLELLENWREDGTLVTVINESLAKEKANITYVDGRITDVDGRITEVNTTIDNLTTQLAQKVTKNLGEITSADLSQEVKEQMTGGSVAVVGKNSVLNENIVDGQVTPGKTTFITQQHETEDVLKDKTTNDGRLDLITGEIVPDELVITTAFVEVDPETRYFVGRISDNSRVYMERIAYYNSNKLLISAIVNRLAYFDTTPEETKYIRISVLATQLTDFKFAKLQKFGLTAVKNQLTNNIITPTINSDDIAFIKPTVLSRNHLEGVTAYEGRVDTNGLVVSDSNVQTTGYIEVNENTTYWFTKKDIPNERVGMDRVVYYDESLSVLNYNFSVAHRVDTPVNCKYVRLSRNSSRPPFSNIKMQIVVSVPEYYSDIPIRIENTPAYVKSDIDEQLTKIARHSGNTVKFIFMTDIHESNNHLKYLSDVMESGQFDFAILNGDFLNDSTTYDEVAKALIEQRKILNDIQQPLLVVRGNHDGVSGDSGGTPFDDEHFFDVAIKQGVTSSTVVGDKIDGYYYTDFPIQKVRVISLNSAQTGYSRCGFRPAQLKWLAENALNMSDKTDWNIIVHSHHNSYTQYSSITTPANASAFNSILESACAGTSYTDTVETTDISVDYSTQGAMPIIHLFGHVHLDIIDKPQNVVQVSTVCTIHGIIDPAIVEFEGATSPSERKILSDTEYAFDLVCLDMDTRTGYMYRMGAGDDRVFSY